MKRKIGNLVTAVAMVGALMGIWAMPASASCSSTSITIYVNNPPGGGSATFCSSVSNLANVPGPCNFGTSWNDCVSSVKVTLGQTWCLKLYADSGYHNLMLPAIWGPETNVVHSTDWPVNDELTSFLFYQKSPPTPAGNC